MYTATAPVMGCRQQPLPATFPTCRCEHLCCTRRCLSAALHTGKLRPRRTRTHTHTPPRLPSAQVTITTDTSAACTNEVLPITYPKFPAMCEVSAQVAAGPAGGDLCAKGGRANGSR